MIATMDESGAAESTPDRSSPNTGSHVDRDPFQFEDDSQQSSTGMDDSALDRSKSAMQS
jgi:hypothetical protein